MKYLPLIFLAACGGAQVRAVMSPSPCTKADHNCVVAGYELWGNEEQMKEAAEDLCEEKSARLTMSFPHREYGFVWCDKLDKGESRALIVTTQATQKINVPGAGTNVEIPVEAFSESKEAEVETTIYRPKKQHSKKSH